MTLTSTKAWRLVLPACGMVKVEGLTIIHVLVKADLFSLISLIVKGQ